MDVKTPNTILDPLNLPPEEVDALALDSVFNHSHDHIFCKDRQSRFVKVSTGLLSHFQLKNQSEIIGKTDFDFFCEEHAREAYEDEQRVIETGIAMPPKVEREIWPDRPDTWASTTKIPWRNRDGVIIGVFGISRDVTREHILRLELEKQTALLENSNRELEQFAFIASHDLQEPLRMISGFVQLIQRRYEEKLDDRGKSYIRFAVEGATRMQSLIDGLLQYSRVKSKTGNMQPVDCSVVFADVVRNLRRTIEETDTQVEINGDLPTVTGVHSQISQVFQNLLQNAIKFHNPSAPPLIRLSVSRTDDEVVIAVADNGIGIDPKYAERVFGMFQRLHTREKYEGNGIGLAMAKRIMNHHGGDIRLESQLGHGSCFYLSFPNTDKVHEN